MYLVKFLVTLGEPRVVFFQTLKREFDLHLQIIKSNFPKASVENSSAQWAILFYNLFQFF